MKIGNYEADLLFKMAHKKADLQHLIDRVDDLSISEIRALNIKPWQKKGLVAIKNYNDWVRRGRPDGIVHILDVKKPVYVWDGPTVMIPSVSLTSEMLIKDIEIQHGRKFLIDDDNGGVWFGAILVKNPDIDFSQTTRLIDMTRKEYIAAYKADLASEL